MIQLGGNFVIESIKIGAGAWQDMEMKMQAPFERVVHINIVKLPDCTTTAEQINDDIRLAKERYAQAGVKLKVDRNTSPPFPPNITNSDIQTRVLSGPFKTPVGENAKKIISAFGTPSIDDIHVFYCRSINDPSVGPEIGRAYPEIIFEGQENSLFKNYANNLFVTAAHRPFTLAHEIGHLLTNRGHFVPPETELDEEGILYQNQNFVVEHNLMKLTSSETNEIVSSKRLYQDQENWIHTHRAAKNE